MRPPPAGSGIGPVRKVVWRAKHNPPRTVQSGQELIAGGSANQLSGQRGWEAESKNESRFLGECIDGSHASIGNRRHAVGNQNFLRHVNRQEAGSNKSEEEEVRDHGIPSAAAEACCSIGRNRALRLRRAEARVRDKDRPPLLISFNPAHRFCGKNCGVQRASLRDLLDAPSRIRRRIRCRADGINLGRCCAAG